MQKKSLLVFVLVLSFFHFPTDAMYQGSEARLNRLAASVEWGMIFGTMVMQPKNAVIRDMIYPLRIASHNVSYEQGDAILASYFTNPDQNQWKVLLREYIIKDDDASLVTLGFDSGADSQNDLLDDEQRTVLNFFSVIMGSKLNEFLSGKEDFLSPETAIQAFGRMRPEFIDFFTNTMKETLEGFRSVPLHPAMRHALPLLTEDVLREASQALVEREQGGVVSKRWETILLNAGYPDRNNAPWAGGHQRLRAIEYHLED